MSDWRPIPIKNKIYENVSETTLNVYNAALENAYVNEMGAITRFPLLSKWVKLPGDQPVYLKEWRGDLIAVTGGNTYRLDEDGNFTDITEAVVSGPGRVVFAKTEEDLLMAAGKQIIKLESDVTQVLSPQAPETTHVGFIDGYAVAIENGSGRFQAALTPFIQWDPLDTFSAEGKPDNIISLLVTQFGELLLAGPESIEQFDSAPGGTKPFFKRWGLGSGVVAPYTFISVDNRSWGINLKHEWTAFSTQLSNIASGDIQNSLEKIKESLADAWATELPIDGHRFILVQIPKAINVYDTVGITLLYDYIARRWSQLFNWDYALSRPTRWAGWSYEQVGNTKYVGGNGWIYKIGGFPEEGLTQRLLWRSGHISGTGTKRVRLEAGRITLRRGVRENRSLTTLEPILSVRVNKDNKGFGRWVRKPLGVSGEREMVLPIPAMGEARTFQFEIEVTDNIPVDIIKLEVLATDLK